MYAIQYTPMPIDSDLFTTQFGDVFLEFELTLDEVELLDDGTVEVDASLEKLTDEIGGITYTAELYIADELVDEDSTTSEVNRRSFSFTGEGVAGDVVEIRFYEPDQGLSESELVATVEGEVPTPPFDVADVEVSCSVSEEEVEIGEEVTVTVDLTNDTPSSGVVEVEAVFWDASDSVTEELSEDDEVTVEFTFVPEEEGEVEPSVSVTEA